ncbi:hypothetical protein [Streptomyces sp. NBC_01565]|uniref:hypothetical protein n=1 Tax=unclassified Streptomyces TaxID=2593676 RepID=UPI0022512555|nr:hypothetical protein [Streptomyces sp. NBC_01565]MCX4546645.1 hypothetical protein [Streptomyces sp. NBC_01565]
MAESTSPHQSLPTWDQVVVLRDFIHARTYAAAVPTIRLKGEPPHTPGSALARVAEVNGALYEVTSHLCRCLYGELTTGRPGPIADASWAALASIAAAWREDPELPDWMSELLVTPR